MKIVAISLDKKPGEWKKAVQAYKTGAWHHVLVHPQIENEYFNSTSPIPSKILIDRKGAVLFNSLASDAAADLEKIIQGEVKLKSGSPTSSK